VPVLYNVNFGVSVLYNVNFGVSVLYNVNFGMSVLYNVNFGMSVLYNVNFRMSVLYNVNFEMSVLYNVNFGMPVLSNLKFGVSVLYNVLVIHIHLMKTQFILDTVFPLADLKKIKFQSILTISQMLSFLYNGSLLTKNMDHGANLVSTPAFKSVFSVYCLK
jgi:uncharacterized protein YjbI with pentapeptide repeats